MAGSDFKSPSEYRARLTSFSAADESDVFIPPALLRVPLGSVERGIGQSQEEAEMPASVYSAVHRTALNARNLLNEGRAGENVVPGRGIKRRNGMVSAILAATSPRI